MSEKCNASLWDIMIRRIFDNDRDLFFDSSEVIRFNDHSLRRRVLHSNLSPDVIRDGDLALLRAPSASPLMPNRERLAALGWPNGGVTSFSYSEQAAMISASRSAADAMEASRDSQTFLEQLQEGASLVKFEIGATLQMLGQLPGAMIERRKLNQDPQCKFK